MPPPSPSKALAKVLARLAPIESEAIALARSAGRILAEPLTSDRPSPPADVSAMDGYALRLGDIADLNSPLRLPIAAEVAIGHAPPPLPPAHVLRIFTGGAIPSEADVVLPREWVKEEPETILIPPGLTIRPGQHIRRRGDNLAAHQTVLEAGQAITPAVAAALAAFGYAAPRVHRRVSLAVIVTGNELLPVDAHPQPWQLRDSNGPMLASLFSNIPWIELAAPQHIDDDPTQIQHALRAALEESDAILLTGGVSMGDHDYVPAAIEGVGGQIVFHKLPLRPGKPLLGAIGPNNQAIFGLPGNPLSSLITARRLAAVALRKLGGFAAPDPPPPVVELSNPDGQSLPLWWYRLVKLIEPGRAELVRSQGSGDLVSAARSDGFIEISPEHEQKGVTTHFPFYSWSLT
jgi:molybdopterin molybdotransferase